MTDFKVGDRVRFTDNWDGVSGEAKITAVDSGGVHIDAHYSDGSERFLRLYGDWAGFDECERVKSANPESSDNKSEAAKRKAQPIARGVLDYFPAALIAVSELSRIGNEKHNPGQPLHHSRSKSSDHADCIVRHLLDRGTIDPETGLSHSVAVAWRALALLQEELEASGAAPKARGAK